MGKVWKLVSSSKRKDGHPPAIAYFLVAVSDLSRALATLRLRQGLQDADIDVVGEADSGTRARWGIEEGDVVCALALSRWA